MNNITDKRGIPHGQEIDAKTQALLFSPDAKPNKVNGEENHSTLSTHSVLEFRRLLSNSEDHENKEKVRLVSNSKKFENEERVSFIKRLQTRLLLLGYDCGNLDGVMSPMMESCIRDFQEKNKLEKKNLMVTGKMDEATYNVLFSVDAINYGKTSHKLIRRFVNTALGQYGYKSRYITTSNSMERNHSKYGEWFGLNPYKYCVIFISWVANEVRNFTTDKKPLIERQGQVMDMRDDFMNRGKLEFAKNNTYTPQYGDIVFFNWDGRDDERERSHGGIVLGISEDGNYLYTIEGNVIHGSVSCIRYFIDSKYIIAYGKMDSNDAGYTIKLKNFNKLCREKPRL